MPPKNYDDEDFGYNDDDPWGGEEGVGGGRVVLGFDDDDDDEDDYLGCECDDCVPAPAPKPNDEVMDDWVQAMADAADQLAADVDDAQGDNGAPDDDDRIVYDYTDCAGEGDRFFIERYGDDGLFFFVNDSPAVIIRDEQVSDILYALIEFQDRNGDA